MSVFKYGTAISFLLLIAAIYYSLNSLRPHNAFGGEVPLTEFSTERALSYLKEISKEPHYVGSPGHEKVRQYIVGQLENMGLEVQVQQQFAINGKWHAAADTKNILARIKGSDNSRALLLLTHYDSAPHSSFGASDAGSGVVTILEGVRAFLAKNKVPKNDIIILISDAEELGLLGASAFVNNHPWAKDVGLVLNFEARGSGGPSYMLLETNGGNKKLIEQFRKSKPLVPVGTSLLYSIYKMLPNDTDLTVFREDGNIDGFNFAFIDDHFDYHTAHDNYERLDKESLEHQAAYLMPMMEYFANNDLSNLKSQHDYVYFNFPFIGMVYYPFSWVLPMAIVVSLLFIILLIYGFYKRQLTGKGVLKGLVAFVSSLVISGLISHFGWQFLLKIHPQYNDILQGFTYNGHWYIAFFIALTLMVSFRIYNRHFKKFSDADLLIAPLFFWILINIMAAYFLKGAGYFIIAALYGLIVLSVMLFSNVKDSQNPLLFSILSLPVLIVIVPMIQTFPVGLGLKIIALSSILTVLLFGLLTPVFSSYRKIKLGKLMAVLAVVIFVTASFKSGYSVHRKQPNSLNYVLDADANKAYWTSYNNKPDVYTRQFLGDEPLSGSFEKNTNSSKYRSQVKLHQSAVVEPLPLPEITILQDTMLEVGRKVHLQIRSQRDANRLDMIADAPVLFKEMTINGVALKKKDNTEYVLALREPGQTVVNFYFTTPDEALDIEFITDIVPLPNFTLYEIAFNLLEDPHFKVNPRLEDMMPMPFVINDATIIKKGLTLPVK